MSDLTQEQLSFVDQCVEEQICMDKFGIDMRMRELLTQEYLNYELYCKNTILLQGDYKIGEKTTVETDAEDLLIDNPEVTKLMQHIKYLDSYSKMECELCNPTSQARFTHFTHNHKCYYCKKIGVDHIARKCPMRK